MIIAVSTQGKDLSSQVDPRFGRAAGFIIYDTDSKDAKWVDNAQNLSAAQGAGIQAAQNAAETGAKAVITGHIGPKAFAALNKGGIDIFLGASGTVEEALKQYETGALQATDAPDKQGHW